MAGVNGGFLFTFLEVMSALFVFVLGVGVVLIIVWYIQDVTQTKHAIRRNYPVVGRFRYLFEHLGEFFRQYFFAMDREELPFNRAERSWVYRASKNVDNTVAFIVEPGVNIELNLTKFLRFSTGVSYRYVTATQLDVLDAEIKNTDLSNLSYNASFKFGFY